MKIIFVTVLVSFWAISPSTGFIPKKYFAWTFDYELPLDLITHTDMSRAAILEVAADVLRDNPNPESEGSTSRISALSSLNEKNLITAYYGERQPSILSTFRGVIRTINDANADVDLGGEEKVAAAHFDSEQFQAGQNRLVEKRQNIGEKILSSDFDLARAETGRLFHTLQDFYSHSNWIENGNRVPYSVLGKIDERPGIVAGPTTQTCRDCTRAAFTIAYRCENNIVTNLLTSGYHGKQRDSDGQEIIKPHGKCSHGGFLDTTSDADATGGINKDSPFRVWSPHLDLYNEAARVAQQATADMLQEIRSDVNNDQLFSMYLGIDIAAQSISIAYVIDTSESMDDELPEIQATIPRIRADLNRFSANGNMNVRYILVPFNDPDMSLFSV